MVVFLCFYCLRISNSITTAPMTIIATNMTIDNGRKYKSAAEGGVSVGAGEASGAGSTTNAVVAEEP